jgi:hypothetical protein
VTIKLQLEDGYGSGNKVRIGDEGEQYVVVHPHPPRNEVAAPLPLRRYMTLDGVVGGDNDMRKDGSVNEIEFSIKAIDDKDIYVASLSFVISDAGATLSQFGNIGALANGFELKWVTQEFGTEVLADSLKTNFEFMRLAGGDPPFGDGANAFRANNISGTSEGYIPFIDFDEIFGIKWGLRLRAGTTDKLSLIIKDNVTGVDQFDCIGYGMRF